ncbi:sugar ABC transporter permease [Propioniciclava coleopterorum]|uniref:Sugar ABC transporter permease n=1 Tax=Propioniciclava coleopterorum TaxID=2714937 RepID=A0A6G7Y8M5_9ACTN|nr:sugar ABC transporter permease [Propioniciclava coleopterorum]QIK73130.1 sugar ABC transporter permease [Propioniciclava coleopterorum]
MPSTSQGPQSTASSPHASPAARRSRLSRRTLREWALFVLLAAPNVALILAFTYRPLLTNVYYSTLDWTLGSETATPVGLGNYVEFFTGPDAVPVLRTTAVFTVATVGGSILLGLALSTVLNRRLLGRGVARATVFAPYVLSGVGIGLVWMFIFDPTTGVLSGLLRGAGLPVPEWFLKPELSLAMVIIVYVWKNLGYCAVIYLAALQAIPPDLLEAAAIDGAGRWRRFRSIVWPLLSPTSFFLLMTMLLSSLQAFDLIRIMTPLGNGTTTLMYDAYLQAFGGYNRAGYSSAIATILFVVLICLTLVQLRVIERKVHYA